jgi:hypothetical protein
MVCTEQEALRMMAPLVEALEGLTRAGFECRAQIQTERRPVTTHMKPGDQGTMVMTVELRRDVLLGE